MNIDIDKVTELDFFRKTLTSNQNEFNSLYREASDYVSFYDWCDHIEQSYVGMFYPGILGIFLFKIKPSRDGVDDFVWVIVGDLPPAYITCEDSPNPACALDSYIGAMTEWVEAAKLGKSVSKLIPVNVPATYENAVSLKKRLDFLDAKILSDFSNDLY